MVTAIAGRCFGFVRFGVHGHTPFGVTATSRNKADLRDAKVTDPELYLWRRSVV